MNNVIPQLISAKPLTGYTLLLEFEDGIKGSIDLSEWKGKGVFEYWNNEDNFRDFHITDDKKLEWTEDIDMDPDAFYLTLVGKTFQEYADNKQLLRHSD